MSETRWTYYDPTGGIQALGLYHGKDSGNVVIYHNHKVLVVDFLVHKSKTYSVMINQQLVKFNVTKEDGKFDYKIERTVVNNQTSKDSIPLTQKVMTFLSKPFRG